MSTPNSRTLTVLIDGRIGPDTINALRTTISQLPFVSGVVHSKRPTYRGNRCRTCGNHERYLSSRQCINCHNPRRTQTP